MRALLCFLLIVGCVPQNGPPPTDVRGNYALTHANELTLKLNLAGGVRERTASGYGDVVDFGTHEGQPLTLDLNAFCGREDVVCPSESLWSKVSIDQPNLHSRRVDAFVINVIDDTVHELPAGQHAKVLGGFVTQPEDRFLVGIGAQGQTNESCALLGVSLAGGRFTHEGESVTESKEFRDASHQPCDPADAGDACTERTISQLTWPDGARVNGIAEGRVATAFLGGCAFGPIVVGATLTIESSFTGTRTGELDPPPYTPVEPEEDLGEADAGTP